MSEGSTRDSQDGAARPQPIQFGIFDWIDECRPLELADLYEQRLRMLEYADEAGFWCYHLAEHHGTPLGMSPSPNVFLAAAAQRTRRIRLGPLVHLLPLYSPLRLIDEICMLDHLSRGRLELGVGRGVSPLELALYDIDAGLSRDMFREALDVVLQGLATGRVGYEGRFYTFAEREILLRPYQRPYPPLWYPSSNPESLSWVAAENFSTLFAHVTGSVAVTRERMAQYQQVRQEHASAAHRLNGHVATPRYGFTRHVYLAETDAEAMRVARDAYGRFFSNFNYLWARHGDPRWEHMGDFTAFLEDGFILVGSPATVRAQLQEMQDAIGGNYIVATFAFGSLTTEQILNSLRLFATQVMPALTRRGAPAASGVSG